MSGPHLDDRLPRRDGTDFPTGDEWDLLVIGAGPAGALSALLAARTGRSVLLVDRQEFPRHKVCGGCLNNRALGILDQAELLPSVARLRGHWIDRFVVHVRGNQLTVPLAGGLAVSRWALDALLIEQARLAGARFLAPARASVLPEVHSTPRRRVELSSPGQSTRVVSARVVVVADGLGHPSLARLPEFTDTVSPASRVGLAPRNPLRIVTAGPPRGTIAMAVGRWGYVGLTRDETEEVHVAAAVDPAALRTAGDPARCVARILQDSGIPFALSADAGPWRGTGLLTHRLNRAASHRLFVVGDALRYVEPFTGEGMAWALTNAWRVAPLAATAVEHWSDELQDRWNREAFDPPARGCRWLASVARWPRSTAWLVAGCAHIPAVAALAARVLDPAPPAVAGWRKLLAVSPGPSTDRVSLTRGEAA